MLTNEEYVKFKGIRCPNCRDNKVQATNYDKSGAEILLQDCQCSTCGATWVDVYTLTGYDNLEIKENDLSATD